MVDFSPLPVASSTLHVEHVRDVTLVSLTRSYLGDEAFQEIGDRMVRLAETMGRHRFVLSLRGVRCLSSAMLGKLIAFHKQVKQRGGELTLCSLTPELAARFESMRLNKLFHICLSEEEALGEAPIGVS